VAITHATVKASGERGYVSEWNADHVVTDESKPKNFTTLIVAASNSLDKTRADYVCDGVDDEEEINAALNALPSEGGRISLLEGTYNITDTIIVAKSNTSIEGLGHATTIQTENNINMVYVVNLTNFTLSNLNLYANHTGGSQNCIYLSSITYSCISNVFVGNFGNNGIYLTNCFNIRIIQCSITDCVASAIRADSNEFLFLLENYLENNEYAIRIDSSFFIKIAHNSFLSSTNTSIQITSATYVYISNNHISGAILGIYTDCMTIITNNTISYSDTYAISINGSGSIISNNFIFHSTIGFVYIAAGCSLNNISNNVLTSSSGYGVFLAANAFRNIINNNVFQSITNDVITISAGCDRNIVISNNLSNYSAGSIIDNGTNTEIAHNVV